MFVHMNFLFALASGAEGGKLQPLTMTPADKIIA